jgi:hypothetical protein
MPQQKLPPPYLRGPDAASSSWMPTGPTVVLIPLLLLRRHRDRRKEFLDDDSCSDCREASGKDASIRLRHPLLFITARGGERAAASAGQGRPEVLPFAAFLLGKERIEPRAELLQSTTSLDSLVA